MNCRARYIKKLEGVLSDYTEEELEVRKHKVNIKDEQMARLVCYHPSTEQMVNYRMHTTPDGIVTKVEVEKKVTLKVYQYYGVKPGEEGRPVETYGNVPVDGVVTEIVVFNPDLHSVFSLRGRYTIEELMALDK